MKPYEIALQEYGTKEVVGAGSSARVLEYFAKVGHKWVIDDSTAWCAAFAGFCLETAGIPSTKALNARSYLTWGTSTTTPKVGDIVVLWRDNPQSSLGHVGFFVAKRNGLVYMLAGNQNNEVDISGFPESRVIGYRSVPVKVNVCPTPIDLGPMKAKIKQVIDTLSSI